MYTEWGRALIAEFKKLDPKSYKVPEIKRNQLKREKITEKELSATYENLRHQLEEDHKNIAVYRTFVMKLLEEKREAEAEWISFNALKLNAKDSFFLNVIGQRAFNQAKYDLALKYFQDASLLENNSYPHYNAGLIHFYFTNYENAQMQFRNAYDQNSQDNDMVLMLGVAMRSNKKYDEAEKLYLTHSMSTTVPDRMPAESTSIASSALQSSTKETPEVLYNLALLYRLYIKDKQKAVDTFYKINLAGVKSPMIQYDQIERQIATINQEIKLEKENNEKKEKQNNINETKTTEVLPQQVKEEKIETKNTEQIPEPVENKQIENKQPDEVKKDETVN